MGPDGHWWIERQALASAGLEAAAWPQQERDGVVFADISAAFPQARIQPRFEDLKLEIELPATAWPTQVIHGRNRGNRPRVDPSASRSAYLNYSVSGSESGDLFAFGEMGVVRGFSQLSSTFNFDGNGLRRGLTALDRDQPERRRRWTLGDQVLRPGDPFGSAGLIGGIGVASQFDLDPYLLRFPGADIRGVLQAPGSVEVYANGQLVSRQDVGAGPFSLQDLALGQGSNDLRIVVNDPFAGRYEINDAFYSSPRGLARGLHEYAYRLGWRRSGYLQDDYDTGQLLLSAWHRYGFSDNVTVGLRHEQWGSRSNQGLSMDLRLPLGSLALSAARSGDSGESGWARQIDYSHFRRWFGVSAGGRWQSPEYRQLQQSTGELTNVGSRMHYLSASLAPRPALNLSASLRQEYFADASRSRSISLHLGWRLGRRARLDASATRRQTREGSHENEWRLGLLLPLDRLQYSLGLQQAGGNSNLRASVYSAPPGYGPGAGYRATLGSDAGNAYAEGAYEWVGNIGRLQVNAVHQQGEGRFNVRYSGGLLWAQGRVFPVGLNAQAYALVSTSGIADVPILFENQEVGRSDASGLLLLPGLQPYQPHLIAVDTQKLDIAIEVPDSTRYVGASRHGVARVAFAARRIYAVQAYLTDGSRRLRFGEAKVDKKGGAEALRIGSEGQIYIASLPPGSHVITASSAGSSYRCEIRISEESAMIWLGEVPCTRL